MNVLSVGSCLIDFFVSIEKSAHLEISDGKITLPLGAKVPISLKTLSLGGNSANVTSALHNLSIPTALYTYLGTDPLSKHIREKMKEKEIELIVEDIETTTGSLSLIFDFPTDRIIFSHHNVAEHVFDETKIHTTPDLIFLSSIGKVWERAYEQVLAYAQKNNIPIALSPGSLQLKSMNDVFIQTISTAKILLCNMEEAQRIHKALGGEEIKDPKKLLLSLKEKNFDILSITDGENGAYAIGSANTVHHVDSPKPEGYEKTGAGDAYAGAFLAAHLHKKDITDAMRWGIVNALGEMKQPGAQTGQLMFSQIEHEVQNANLHVKQL